jgi:predicted GNAT superfamily acetyltransferase
MEWTFDPLEVKNAHLNIARLGAIVRRYLPNFYGPSTSPLQGGLPTDRLVAEWWLASDRVARVLDRESEGKAEAGEILEQVDVPAEVYEWKRNPERRKLAEDLQTKNREKFQSAFARGLDVIGFSRAFNGDGSYLLGRPSGLGDSSR